MNNLGIIRIINVTRVDKYVFTNINKISKIGVALLVNLESKCFSSKFTCVLKPQPKKCILIRPNVYNCYMAKKYINDLDLFLSVSIVIWGRIGFAQRKSLNGI